MDGPSKTHKFKKMNKLETIAEIAKGNKITHTLFTKDEWISKYEGSKSHYKDEEGTALNSVTFWKYRQDVVWEKGWSLFNTKMTDQKFEQTLQKWKF